MVNQEKPDFEKSAASARLKFVAWILAEENMGRVCDDEMVKELLSKLKRGDFT